MSKKHLRLTVHGTVLGEPCSFGVSARGDDQWLTFDLGNANDFLVQAEPDTTTMLTTIGNVFGSAVQWTGLRVAGYNDAGDLTAVAEKVFTTAVTNSGAVGLPGYCAVCVTLLTAVPGRQNRGRLYLPVLSNGSCDSTGRLAGTKRDTIVSAISTWLTNLNNAPGIDALVGGYRTVIHSNVGLGHQTDVVGIRVGNVFDAQRRRYNDQQESFVTSSIST